MRGLAHVARHHGDNRRTPLMAPQTRGVGFTHAFPAGIDAKQRADGAYGVGIIKAVAQVHIVADAHPGGLLIFELL